MFPDDFQHGAVGKSLLVIAEPGRRVDTGEDGCLSRGALRAAFNPETRVGWDDDAVEDGCRFFIAKDPERFGIVEAVERIVWTTGANSEPVDEE